MNSHSYLDLMEAFQKLIDHLATSVTARSANYADQLNYYGMTRDYFSEAGKLNERLSEALNLYLRDGNEFEEDHALRKFRKFSERGFRDPTYPALEIERIEVHDIVQDARDSIERQHSGVQPPAPARQASIAPAEDGSATKAKRSALGVVFSWGASGVLGLIVAFLVWTFFPRLVGPNPTAEAVAHVTVPIMVFGVATNYLNSLSKKR